MTYVVALRFKASGGRDGVDFTVEGLPGDFSVSREALEDLERVHGKSAPLEILFDKHAQVVCQAAADLVAVGASGTPIVVTAAAAQHALSRVGRGFWG